MTNGLFGSVFFIRFFENLTVRKYEYRIDYVWSKIKEFIEFRM